MSFENADMGKPLPMSVRNVGFLLDRLGQDCAPLQFLRELTQKRHRGDNPHGQSRTNCLGCRLDFV